MDFAGAAAVADAVLFEGYVLYPYRASSAKNQFRWAFGTLAPRAWSEAGGCEPFAASTQCLLEVGAGSVVRGRLRCLQVQRRTVEARDAGRGTFAQVASVEVDGRLLVPWDEGVLREVDFEVEVGDTGREMEVAFEFGDERIHEEIASADAGTVVARVVRERLAVRGRLVATVEPVAGRDALRTVTVRVENVTRAEDTRAPRDEALRSACIAAHVLLGVEGGGAFVSLLDPPADARDAAAACRSAGLYPVLACEAGRRDVVLAAPIILYDHPAVAPESQGDFHDACEIDELLALRTLTMTPEEKRHARATDARSAAIVDRVEAMPPEAFDRLHGTRRDPGDGEMKPLRRPPRAPARAPADGDALRAYPPGTRVRLRPGPRRTDAQDLLYAGCSATVRTIVQDVAGYELLAVTLDDDPAAELHEWYGRFHYYRTDEVEPLGPVADRAR